VVLVYIASLGGLQKLSYRILVFIGLISVLDFNSMIVNLKEIELLTIVGFKQTLTEVLFILVLFILVLFILAKFNVKVPLRVI